MAALFVEAHERGRPTGFTFAQRYRRGEDGRPVAHGELIEIGTARASLA